MVHAAGESSPGNLPSGTHAVVLGLTAEELLALERVLALQGVPHAAIRDEDQGNALMAIGLRPAPKTALKPLLSQYALLREEAPP